tara:strand:- start:405 stop:731 length:327 start_codon:yes stop_codon:yes gene_type:complete
MNTTNNQTTSNTVNNPKVALVLALMKIGKLFKSKSEKSINIYNPASFDMKTIEQLAHKAGLVAVHNPEPSTYEDPKTGRLRQVPPRLTIAKSQDMDENAALEYLDNLG